MIVSCPECSTDYNIPDDKIGEGGLNVRCGVCSHKWVLEKPDDNSKNSDSDSGFDSHIEELEKKIEDIGKDSDNALPAPQNDITTGTEGENTASPPITAKKEKASNAKTGREKAKKYTMYGYAASFLLFAVISGLFLALKKPVVSRFPSTSLLYDLAGKDIKWKGEGIVFEDVLAKVRKGHDGKKTVSVEGRLINLKSSSVKIPRITVSILDEEGNPHGGWSISPSVSTLEGEDSVNFNSVYNDVPEDVDISSLELSFELTPDL